MDFNKLKEKKKELLDFSFGSEKICKNIKLMRKSSIIKSKSISKPNNDKFKDNDFEINRKEVLENSKSTQNSNSMIDNDSGHKFLSMCALNDINFTNNKSENNGEILTENTVDKESSYVSSQPSILNRKANIHRSFISRSKNAQEMQTENLPICKDSHQNVEISSTKNTVITETLDFNKNITEINISSQQSILNRKANIHRSFISRSKNAQEMQTENLPICKDSHQNIEISSTKDKVSTETLDFNKNNEIVNNVQPVNNNIIKQPVKRTFDETSLTETDNNNDDVVHREVKKRCISSVENISSSKASKVNDNFVKLNMRKRTFCNKATIKQDRNRQNISKAKWKNRMCKCYRCGEEGHYSNQCKKPIAFGPRNEKSNINSLGFFNSVGTKVSDYKLEDLNEISKAMVRKHYFNNVVQDKPERKPLDEDSVQYLLNKALKIYKFTKFREHQEQVIRRIMNGKSTLAVLPTGSGKSLCYQIPAHLLNQIDGSVALIISPLISLMQDQLAKLPRKIKGVTLNSTMKYEAKLKLMEEIKNGEYSFVLLSPEALVDSTILTLEKLPKISFACIDEVHCLSDWSHHFRPSYLRVCKLLREKFKVNCFLGLSATCKASTMKSICGFLDIDSEEDPESIVRMCPLRKNITISVSIAKGDKEDYLIDILKKPPFIGCQSILVYCGTREETSDVARNVRLQLGDEQWSCEAYHAGLMLKERSKLQKKFMKGDIRVLVATVAFGMGLDKPDIGGIIHYSRPRTFANFVQEIGRAGRNGDPANAHVILAPNSGKDNQLTKIEEHEIQRQIFANHVEPFSVRKFLDKLFSHREVCEADCKGHINSIFPSEIAGETNIREETLMTLMCYLELMPAANKSLTLLPASYSDCKLSCYGGQEQLAKLSHKSLALSIALSQSYSTNPNELLSMRSIEFNMIDIWEKYGLEALDIRRQIKSLEWETFEDKDPKGETITRYKPSKAGTEFSKWCWVYASKCDLKESDYDNILNYLLKRLSSLENNSIKDANDLFDLFYTNVSDLSTFITKNNELNQDIIVKSENIKAKILNHFECEDETNNTKYLDYNSKEVPQYSKSIENETRNHIRSFIMTFKKDYSDISPKSIVSVLHGIGCPQFPTIYWVSQKKYWKSVMYVDFITLMKWCSEELKFLA